MRQFILFVLIATLFSCAQSDTKQKEVELKTKDSVITIAKIDTAQSPTAQPLTLTPLNIEGDMGYVTFSQKGKTIFYYDAKSKKGKIMLNGNAYTLSKLAGSYTLSGDNVSITTTKGRWAEMTSDCAYGKALTVTITMGGGELKLNDVEVQDCSGMVE